MTLRRPLIGAAAVVALSACQETPPDRALERLAAEQRRLAEGGDPGGPRSGGASAELTQALLTPEPPRKLPVLAGTTTWGALALEVREATAAQQVRGRRSSLTTAERFLKVVLLARASQPTPVALGDATLRRGEQTVPVARDAQTVGEGSPLAELVVEPGAPQTLVVYFEVPPSMLGRGLKMILGRPGSAVELPLE